MCGLNVKSVSFLLLTQLMLFFSFPYPIIYDSHNSPFMVLKCLVPVGQQLPCRLNSGKCRAQTGFVTLRGLLGKHKCLSSSFNQSMYTCSKLIFVSEFILGEFGWFDKR